MTYLLDHWLAFACLLIACLCGGLALSQRQRHGTWEWRAYLPALLFAAYGVGALGLLTPWWLGLATLIAALLAFAVLLFVVIFAGFWSAPLGYALAAVLFFGLGDFTTSTFSDGLRIAGVFLVSMRPQEPWWLLLLALIPVLFWTGWHNLVTLGATRRWLALGFRCSLVIFMAFALAEMFARRPNDSVTTIFLWDRSLSIPPDIEGGIDTREERMFQFINRSVEVGMARSGHAEDRVGVIVFGKQPRLELPPSSVPKLGFKKILSPIDNTYTDISAAIKLALASFPEGSAKRIVLISDGNENRGQAEEQARIAKQNGVQVDVLPIAAARKHINEILVERIEAPPVTERDTRLPLRVVVRSFHPQIVVAQLNLRKVTFDQPKDKKDLDQARNSTIVKLRQGLNVFYFQQAGAKDDTAFSYEANVVPLRVETPEGALVHKGLPGDRIDNNEARVTVMSRGQRAILILEGREQEKENQVAHQLLIDRLRVANPSMKIALMTPKQMQSITKGDNERLATFLSKFDAIFLANVPAEEIPPDEQQVIRSIVHDQGAGLVMIGGNQSFGAGGWQNTEIEKALPVNMELKSMKIEGKSGLVMMMHASEMAEGNAWQRKIAKLALEKLSPMDMVGQLHYDHGVNGGHKWHIPFQEIGPNRNRLLRLVDSMEPGDMPDVDPAFEKALKELANPEYKLGTKHIIFISDGDHWNASLQMIQKLRRALITCTTVCITTHGQGEVQKMRDLAKALKGRDYHITDPKTLPAIYIKETRLVSQSFVHEGKFEPRVMGVREGPTDGVRDPLPPLWGFVRTTPKESNLVKVMIETPKLGQYKFPILAAWQYGLGKSVAFTSDARTMPGGKTYWDKEWANDDHYSKFWEQMTNWVLRPTESGKHLFLTTEQKDGKIRIIVEAQEADKTPITDVELKAGITSPAFKVKDGRKVELKFEQKNVGVFEAEIPADEVGAYFINIQAKWKKETIVDGKKVVEEFTDNVRAGVTIPYSPEFAETDSNPALLEKIRDMTGGKTYRDDAAALKESAANSEVFRPVPQSHASLQPLWPWFVFLAALCLLFDVAIRRIAIQPEAVWAKAENAWLKLRGQAMAETTTEFMQRLRSRKAQVSETMDKEKAAKKYEAGATDVPIVSGPTVAAPQPEKPKPPPEKPKAEAEAGDFATRLMRAKKKAMDERDKDKLN